jgi:hypothetical protein
MESTMRVNDNDQVQVTAEPVIELSPEDERHYEAFERFRDLIRDRTEAVARRHHNGALLVGRPGTSKTVTVEETLRELEVPWTTWNARVSPMGLWTVLRENPESTIVLDDVSTLFAPGNKQALQVLLAALGGSPGEPRVVRYATKEDRTSFEFAGGIVAVGNRQPKRDPIVDALVSRMSLLEHEPSDEMIAAFMRKQVLGGYKDLHPQECREVVEFVIAESRAADYRLDLRQMVAALEDFRFGQSSSRSDWKVLVRSSLKRLSQPEPVVLSNAEEIERDKQRVAKAMEQYPGDTEKQMEASGLKRSTFFKRRKEVESRR